MGTFILGAGPGAAHEKWLYMSGHGVFSLGWDDAVYRAHDIFAYFDGERPWLSSRSNKVMYTSPEFSGFSFAASYTPVVSNAEPGEWATYSEYNVATNDHRTDIFELQGLFSMDGFHFGAGFASQNPRTSALRPERNSVNVLMRYAMDGLSVGAGYVWHPMFSSERWTVYGGAEYAFTDSWTIGGGYLTHDNNANGRHDSLIVANLTYAIAKNAKWNVSVDIPTPGNNWIVATGLSYSFEHHSR